LIYIYDTKRLLRYLHNDLPRIITQL